MLLLAVASNNIIYAQVAGYKLDINKSICVDMMFSWPLILQMYSMCIQGYYLDQWLLMYK